MAMPPSCVAGRDERPPPSFPTGVRAVPRITVLGMGLTIASAHGRPSHHRRPARHRRGHDRRRHLRREGRPARRRGRRARGARGGRRGPLGLPQARGRARRGQALDPRSGSASATSSTHERARIAAATALGRARELGARVLCWELPAQGAGRRRRARSSRARCSRPTATRRSSPSRARTARPDELIVSAHHDVAAGRRGGADRRRGGLPGARPRQRAGQRDDARGARRAGAGAAGRDRRGAGRRGDPRRRDGRVRRGRRRARRPTRGSSRSATSRRARTGRCSASSARP